MRIFIFIIAGVLLAATSATASSRANVRSPSRNLQLTFFLEGGSPHYAVRSTDGVVIAKSRLGLSMAAGGEPDASFEILSTERKFRDHVWEQVWGEERFIRDRHRELKVALRERATKRELNIVFRVFDDGIGFRYEVPEQKNFRKLQIFDELTEFNLPGDPAGWWIDGYDLADYEQHYRRDPISKIPSALTPLTIETESGFVSIHEAALVNSSAMVLEGRGAGRLAGRLYPGVDGVAVHAETPWKSSWRTIQIAKSAGALATSYLILNLNEPNRLKDTSWISTGKFIGIWWGMHIGEMTWHAGPKHGATTVRAREYIDAAVRLGIPNVLIEGWNLGWEDWSDGRRFSFTESYPDFDLKAVTDYARERGVHIVGHHETLGAVEHYEGSVDAGFALYEKSGVGMVKTGYVGGKMDKLHWRHGQRMVLHHATVTEKAAAHKIMLDIHEPIKDTGMRRTYPNIMTREGARGGEYDAWGGLKNHNPPGHAAIIPFTRGLSGPFDYTPGIFNLERGASADDRIRTTLAKQLAMYVVIYSPWHMAADLPENYFGHPAFKFIHDVPTDWETTNVPLAKIGEYAVFARKDRRSSDWYVGAVTNADARALRVPLGFLPRGKCYRAEIYGDAGDSHYLKNPRSYRIDTKTVRSGTDLELALAPGGGAAVRLSPEKCL